MHVTTFPSGVISEQSFCCKNTSLYRKKCKDLIQSLIVSTHSLESAYMYINTIVSTSYTLAVWVPKAWFYRLHWIIMPWMCDVMFMQLQASEFLSIKSLVCKWWYLPPLYTLNNIEGVHINTDLHIKEFIDRNSEACDTMRIYTLCCIINMYSILVCDWGF